MFGQRDNNPINDWSTDAVFFLSSVFGLSPLVIINGKFRTGYFLLCYCIAAISATFLLGYASKISVAQRLKNHSVDAFMTLIILAYCATHVVNVYFSCWTIRILNTAMKKMREIDAILSESSVTECHRRSRLDKWLELILIVFYWINSGFHTGFNNTDSFLFALSGTYLALISAEFLIFGKYMLNRFKTSIECVSVLPTLDNEEKKLNIGVSAFTRLCSTQKDLNYVYSPRLALLTLTVLFCTVARLHVAYNKRDVGKIDFVYRANGLVFYWIIFLRVVHCSATIASKSKEFNEILYKLMISDKSKRLLHNQKLQLHISVKREVVFSAGGFFDLDFTLVHSVIAAASTYLAVLVQFQNHPVPYVPDPTIDPNITNTDN